MYEEIKIGGTNFTIKKSVIDGVENLIITCSSVVDACKELQKLPNMLCMDIATSLLNNDYKATSITLGKYLAQQIYSRKLEIGLNFIVKDVDYSLIETKDYDYEHVLITNNKKMVLHFAVDKCPHMGNFIKTFHTEYNTLGAK